MEAAPAGRTLWWRHNAFVLTAGPTRVYFGGEIADIALLAGYRRDRPPVDVALLPVNGLRGPVGRPVVMGPEQAVTGASMLGAQVLIPIHDAHDPHDPVSLLIRRQGDGAAARALAAHLPSAPEVTVLPPGRRWEHH